MFEEYTLREEKKIIFSNLPEKYVVNSQTFNYINSIYDAPDLSKTIGFKLNLNEVKSFKLVNKNSSTIFMFKTIFYEFINKFFPTSFDQSPFQKYLF